MNLRKVRLGVIAFSLAAIPVFGSLPLVINWTASEPVGLYWETSYPSRYAQVCLPFEAEKQAIADGVQALRGACPGGYAPLLKQILQATPSQPIVFTKEGFVLAGKLLPNTAPLEQTRTGRPIHHIAFGLYTAGCFTISDKHSHSYDSRYFGPIAASSIHGYAIPVFVH